MATHDSPSFRKGEDWKLTVNVTDAGGNPFTVASARFELLNRWSLTDPPVLSFTGAPQVTLAGSSVVVRIAPGSDQSAPVSGAIYVWRVWATDTSGLVSDQVEGEFMAKA